MQMTLVQYVLLFRWSVPAQKHHQQSEQQPEQRSQQRPEQQKEQQSQQQKEQQSQQSAVSFLPYYKMTVPCLVGIACRGSL